MDMSLKTSLSAASLKRAVEKKGNVFSDSEAINDIASGVCTSVEAVVKNNRMDSLISSDIQEINNLYGTKLKEQCADKLTAVRDKTLKSDVLSGVFDKVSLIDYQLESGKKLNVSFNKEIPLVSADDLKALNTTSAGQSVVGTLSQTGSVTNAVSVSVADTNGNKTVAGLAAGGAIYNPGSDGSLYVTTAQNIGTGQTVVGAGNFTQEDKSAVVSLRLNKDGANYERIISAGVDNDLLGAGAGIRRKADDYTLNAGVGVKEDKVSIKTQYENEINSQTKLVVSAVAEESTGVEAKVVRNTGTSSMQLACLMSNRQAELKAIYQQGGLNASLGTSVEKEKDVAVVASLGYSRSF